MLVARAREYLANPFEDVASWTAAEAALAGAIDQVPRAVDALLAAEDNGGARRLCLAAAIHDAARGREPAVLDRRRVPDRTFAALKLAREAVAGMATAAARCTERLNELIGPSPAMTAVRAALWRSCFGDSVYEAIRLQPFIREQHVLLLGETGTGKELAARAIAAAVPHPAPPSQAVNAAAIPRDLLESELFGHVRGAFTGATGDREGKIVAAHRGTLLLDEVADLSPEIQPKLLRVLATGKVVPVGANDGVDVAVRYVSATSQPLVDMVERGGFRRDLYERLAGLTIEIPPLRDRPQDIEPIAEAIFARFAARLGLEASTGTHGSTAQLSRVDTVQARFRGWLESPEGRARTWPGNVRELENEVRTRLLGFTGRAAGGESLARPAAAAQGSPLPPQLARFAAGEASLREVEDWYILHVLDRSGYSQRQAAKILGVDRGTLARRLRQIDDGEPGDES
jgi:DNA-binding NtrC family response regulator